MLPPDDFHRYSVLRECIPALQDCYHRYLVSKTLFWNSEALEAKADISLQIEDAINACNDEERENLPAGIIRRLHADLTWLTTKAAVTLAFCNSERKVTPKVVEDLVAYVDRCLSR